MKLGIVGLPNVGKSTLFNAITNSGAEAANYPFCTIEPNVGIVEVPDERLSILFDMYESKKIIPAIIEFVDIAGLVKGASKGEGLGNKFLSNIREVDAIIHVVRCFSNDEIVHVDGTISPLRDIETIELELILSDIEILTKRIEKSLKMAKADKSIQIEVDVLTKLKSFLEDGKNARDFECNEDEQKIINTVLLLSNKPVIYVANMTEDDFINNIDTNEYYKSLTDIAKKENKTVLPICAKLESEIAEMQREEKLMFLSELGLKSSGLDRVITKGYDILGLISFITAGKQEIHAWTIKKGTKAPQAAGRIHTDFEKGFIRAEVVAFKDLNEHKSINAVKEKGLIKIEGKEYVVKDGDIILFRFNV